MLKHKKLFLLFTILTIGLTACGASPAIEEASSQPKEVQSVAPPSAQNTEQSAPAPQTAVLIQKTQETTSLSYSIVDTDQGNCYSAQTQSDCPQEGAAFYGQDAQYDGNQPSYTNNGDGTITDNVTGLMWQQDPGEKMTYQQAAAGADSFTLAGYDDWRLPTIKELYSLIQFDGLDPSGPSSTMATPFIDTDYFNFEYGDESAGERIIDSQWATSSIYTDSVMGGQQAMFGVNFADGRIKGYPTSGRGRYFVIYVRDNTAYGENIFSDNFDGTVTDQATGLTWTQNDSASGMNFEAALNYCESLDTAGIIDWRLPNAKELQSIVDYSRSPDATNSAAIDPIFSTSTITNEAGQLDFPAFWSSTTHANLRGGNGAYINFGRSMGYMNGQWMDVHGAGAQRSDPKTGSASDYPTGHGPQGDAIRVDNYVRCVSDSSTTTNIAGNPSAAPSSSGATGTTTQPPSGQSAPGQNQGNGQGRPEIDLASAAAKLGVTEEALRSALGPPPPDLAAAAAQLGVTEQALIEALGIPAGGPPAGAPNG